MDLIAELKQLEGFRARPYKDTQGFLTIGYGLNLDRGMDEKLASYILEYEIAKLDTGLSNLIPFWGKLSRPRQEVLINMAYNLGVAGLLQFKRMLKAAELGNISGVCAEMKGSKWYTQVPNRVDYIIEKYMKG